MDKWISTKKEIPPAGTRVLVIARDWSTEEPFMIIAYLSVIPKQWLTDELSWIWQEHILAWQPLPDIPDRFYPVKEDDETIS